MPKYFQWMDVRPVCRNGWHLSPLLLCLGDIDWALSLSWFNFSVITMSLVGYGASDDEEEEEAESAEAEKLPDSLKKEKEKEKKKDKKKKKKKPKRELEEKADSQPDAERAKKKAKFDTVLPSPAELLATGVKGGVGQSIKKLRTEILTEVLREDPQQTSAPKSGAVTERTAAMLEQKKLDQIRKQNIISKAQAFKEKEGHKEEREKWAEIRRKAREDVNWGTDGKAIKAPGLFRHHGNLTYCVGTMGQNRALHGKKQSRKVTPYLQSGENLFHCTLPSSTTAPRSGLLLVPIAPQASLDLLCNPDWTDAEVTPGHCTPRHNRWCHIHSLIEPDWSDNSAAHRTFICDSDPFEPPFDVFDSGNSYADFVNTDATLSSDICSHADTSNTDD
eukprot:g57748.t1